MEGQKKSRWTGKPDKIISSDGFKFLQAIGEIPLNSASDESSGSGDLSEDLNRVYSPKGNDTLAGQPDIQSQIRAKIREAEQNGREPKS